jgi:hypothetical protein
VVVEFVVVGMLEDVEMPRPCRENSQPAHGLDDAFPALNVFLQRISYLP